MNKKERLPKSIHNKHLALFAVGQRVRSTEAFDLGICPSGTHGTVIGHTEDNGTSTYDVKFVNETRETQVYSDEIEAI